MMSSVSKEELLEKVAFLSTAKAAFSRGTEAVKSNPSVSKAADKLKKTLSTTKGKIQGKEKYVSGAGGIAVGHATGKLSNNDKD